MRPILLAGIVSLLLLYSGPAAAEEPIATREQAETLVEKGLRFARSGEFADAVEQFESALKLYPSAEIMHSLARAHEELGHLSEAHHWFGKALETSPGYLYAEDARGRIGQIEEELRKSHGLLHIRSIPAQARVSITAGSHRARHLITPVSRWVPAGAVDLVAERAGFDRADQQINVVAGENRTLEMILTPIGKKGFVTITASVTGAVVTIDGVVVGRTPLSMITLTEGTHVVAVQAPGHPAMTRTVEITADEAAPAMAFSLGSAEAESTEKAPVLWSGVLFGGGVASLIAGVVFHVKYIGLAKEGNTAFDEVKFHNSQNDSQAAIDARTRADSSWDEANLSLGLSIASYVVSAGLTGVGLRLMTRGEPKEAAPSSAEAPWVPWLSAGANHGLLGVRLQF